MKPILLINSGAYVDQELAAEFGQLPPAFLPVGLGRLFELQLDSFGDQDVDVVLTVPDTFEVSAWDRERLAARGVQLIGTPEGASLGWALLEAISQLGVAERPLRLLHGDTLIWGLDLAREDVAAVTRTEDAYRWGSVELQDGKVATVRPPARTGEAGQLDLTLAGYFAFGHASALSEALALERGSFFKALTRYAQRHGLGTLAPGKWFDFGHVQTYFRSRRLVTTSRAFNSLEISETAVRKRSHDERKLRAEAAWLASAPLALLPYAARLIGEGRDERGFFYETEYEYIPSLSELYLFGDLNPAAWKRILRSCETFLRLSVEATPELEAKAGPRSGTGLGNLVGAKTRERMACYVEATGFDIDAENLVNGRPAPSVRACMDAVESIVASEPPRPSVMHGDFCFSNILFNARTGRIRVIDPRGIAPDGRLTLLGDVRYDIAKLMHSMVGRYDLIIGGRFEASQVTPNAFELAFNSDPSQDWLEAHVRGTEMAGVPLASPVVAATTVSLFLSMLPLHADRPDRQTAFLANALRLFLELERPAG